MSVETNLVQKLGKNMNDLIQTEETKNPLFYYRPGTVGESI